MYTFKGVDTIDLILTLSLYSMYSSLSNKIKLKKHNIP